MQKSTCTACNKNKTAIQCESCAQNSCKNCSYFTDEDNIEFLDLFIDELKDKVFCPTCYYEKVSPQLETHQAIVLKAKSVDVYTKDQSSETRLIRRIEKPIHIEQCNDREEALLSLAFLAAQKGYSTIVDVELKSKKVKLEGTYQTLVWNGSGVPVEIKPRHK